MHPEVKRLAQDPTAGETQPGFGPRQLCPRALTLKARVRAQGPPHCLESKGRNHNPTSPGGGRGFLPEVCVPQPWGKHSACCILVGPELRQQAASSPPTMLRVPSSLALYSSQS